MGTITNGLRRRKGRTMRALAVALSVLLITPLTVLAALTPAQSAHAADYKAHLETVSDDEFIPPGYNWSMSFSDVEDEGGWAYTDNLAQYYIFDNVTAGNTLVRQGDNGYMIAIDADVHPDGQSLRFTGATYGDMPVDAVVTVTNWTYMEPPDGSSWQEWLERSGLGVDFTVENFTPGIYYNPAWHPDEADTGDMINNFNFYTVGLCDLEIEVNFYQANTNTPVEVSGHLTCIDLDVEQKLAFGGAIDLAQVAQESLLSGHLFIEDESIVASSLLSIGDALVDPNYKLGLVSCYFAYTSTSEPALLKFVTSYKDATTTPISFFAMTNEYMTAANPDDDEGAVDITKTADKTSRLTPGDIVTFDVDAAVHERGVNCRSDWYYTSFEITDALPAEMRYVEGSAYLADDEGNPIEGAGTIVADGQANTVTFVFDEDYLKDVMPMAGEHYHLMLQGEVTSFPDDGSMVITNNAHSCVNGTAVFDAEPLDLDLAKPVISIEKSAESPVVELGEDAYFTVVVANVGDVCARNVVIRDVLPDELRSVKDSLVCSLADAVCELAEDEIVVTLSELAADDTCCITFKATVIADGDPTITNTATASADDADEVSDDADISTTPDALPQAGGIGWFVIPLIGAGLLAIAAVFGIRRRRTARRSYFDNLMSRP